MPNVLWALAPTKAFQQHHLDAGQTSGCAKAFPGLWVHPVRGLSQGNWVCLINTSRLL